MYQTRGTNWSAANPFLGHRLRTDVAYAWRSWVDWARFQRSGETLDRLLVCNIMRRSDGIAWDAAKGTVHVECDSVES